MIELFTILAFASVLGSLLIGFPVAFSIGGSSLIFAAIAYAFGAIDISFLNFLPNRIFGLMVNEVLLAIPLFIFMGIMLEKSKVAETMLETLGAAFHWLPGGLGISVFAVGALLAASTGIVGATVIAMGLISLPVMIRLGYDTRLACGVVCASGTLGQIIPPSLILLVLTDQIAPAHYNAQRALGVFAPEPISVGLMFAGALLPGLCLVGLYMLFLFAVGLFLPRYAPAIPKSKLDVPLFKDREQIKKLFNAVMIPMFLIVAVLGSILLGLATPTEAAAIGAVGSVLLAGYRWPDTAKMSFIGIGSLILLFILKSKVDLRLGRDVEGTADYVSYGAALLLVVAFSVSLVACLRRLYAVRVLQESANQTASTTAMAFAIVIGSQIFILVFRGIGGDNAVHEFLQSIPGGATGALMFVMASVFVLGFFLDYLEICFIALPVVLPPLLLLGLDPVWVGVLIAMNLQTSFLTPPFGFSLFYLRGAATATVKTSEIYQGIVPFVGLQLLCVATIWVFPQIVLWLPGVIYE